MSSFGLEDPDGRLELLVRRYDELKKRHDRYRDALKTMRDNCHDWSNDDIRDHCCAALDER